jgi:hypothetical protein
VATLPELAVFIFCLLGCGAHCWRLGQKEGIEGALTYLADAGVIEIEDEE